MDSSELTQNAHTCLNNQSEVILTNRKTIPAVPMEFQNRKEMRAFFQKKKVVYCWQNIVNKKIYIGSSINFWRRFLSYSTNLIIKKNSRINRRLMNSTKCYGFDKFALFILEILSDQDSESYVRGREQYYFDTYEPFNDEIGYNFYSKAILSPQDLRDRRGNVGNRQKGSECAVSKFDEKDIIDIKKRLIAGEKLHVIADCYQVTMATISDIRRGKTWKHVQLSEDEELILKQQRNQNRKGKLSHDLVKRVKADLTAGVRMIDIANKYKLNYMTVNGLKRGALYKYITP